MVCLNTIYHGDCLDVLSTFPDNCMDSCVTDPPYGLSKEPDIREVLEKWLAGEDYEHRGGGFMGKSWDSFVPGPAIWREVYRVLKPGGHALVFAGTRTQDLMTTALRLAGFEVRDVIEWLYFSGFPKSMDVSKAFDKRAGAEREVISERVVKDIRNGHGRKYGSALFAGEDTPKMIYQITAPATPLAKKWDGWGTALKPAHEPIILVRKPLNGTVAENVERWGTGAINIDACRIATFGKDAEKHRKEWERTQSANQSDRARYLSPKEKEKDLREYAKDGRFPANCITLDSDAFYSKYFNVSPPELSKKASKRDRNSDWRGEDIGRNVHPTVKPIDLMAWLVRLVTPEGGTVLDPFAGSGSTLVAARREGFGFIGIEREAEYLEIARARAIGE